MLVLDTNVLIPALQKDTAESQWLRNILNKKRSAIVFSPIVISEYLTKASPKESVALEKLTNYWGIAQMDFETCSLAAKYRARYHKKTKPIYMLDCLVAACARRYKAKLVTYNLKDYPMKDIEIAKPD